MNKIHPTAVIGPEVTLGEGNVIGPYCVLQGPLQLGDNNYLASHVSLGGAADVRGHIFEASWDEPNDPERREGGLVIGDGNVFKEFVSISTGWAHETRLGNNGFWMGKAHASHDALIADGVTIAMGVHLAGHVTIGNDANLGLGVVVHQRAWVGAGCMVGMQAAVRADIPPYAVALGVPARPQRLNSYRLDRMGVSPEAQEQLHAILIDGNSDVGGLPEQVADVVSDWVRRRDQSTTS